MLEQTANLALLIIPGVIIAIFTSILTVRLSIRRFHAEKWWERKEAAYSDLLDIIHGYDDYTSKHLEDLMEPKELSDGEKKSWQADWKKFNKRYARAKNLATLHLSNEAVLILDDYEEDKKHARNDGDWLDWMENDLEASKKCLLRLIDAAKKDLRVN